MTLIPFFFIILDQVIYFLYLGLAIGPRAPRQVGPLGGDTALTRTNSMQSPEIPYGHDIQTKAARVRRKMAGRVTTTSGDDGAK